MTFLALLPVKKGIFHKTYIFFYDYNYIVFHIRPPDLVKVFYQTYTKTLIYMHKSTLIHSQSNINGHLALPNDNN